jgi:hypothetical protein
MRVAYAFWEMTHSQFSDIQLKRGVGHIEKLFEG